MLDSLRRLWSKGPKPTDFSSFEAWAQGRGHELKKLRDVDGCIIEPLNAGDEAWRIEWGESQRSYITTREVRLSAEIGTPRDMLVLLLNRELMETIEKTVFDQYVEDVQTRIDTEAPPEVRWLVMFPKLSGGDLGRLKDRYAGIASFKPWLQQWLGAGLESALSSTMDWSKPGTPVVLTITRGRLTLRSAMAEANAEVLNHWFITFESILPSARQLARDWSELAAGGATGTQPPSEWPSSSSRPVEDE